jgi:hypothetical protein
MHLRTTTASNLLVETREIGYPLTVLRYDPEGSRG